MAASATLISLEQYLRTSYKPDCDFVDGEVQERNVGEYAHSRSQTELIFFFRSREGMWNIRTMVEQRVRVTQDRIRVCDVCLLDRAAPREDVAVTPPLVCIEVLSPEDRLSRATMVLEEYRRMGVKHVWLVDPLRRVAYVLGEEGLKLVQGSRIEAHGTPLFVDLEEIFKELD